MANYKIEDIEGFGEVTGKKFRNGGAGQARRGRWRRHHPRPRPPLAARRSPANLATTLAEVNAEKKLTRRVPPEADVTRWVEHAKEMPRVPEY
jgi:hypothetical protein